MKKIFSIARKELDLYFSSPMALIFVGVFLVVSLFVFFWVDSFFARGIADVRALFEWMPIVMIFLVAALTMHQWSREEESGNLQVLLTMPVRLIQLVLGKFLSVLILVMVALVLTFFLPITVSSLGNLDWGPVIGGYLASLLLASAYISIGLFISSRTDNQLLALIGTVIVCGLFQLVGSPAITNLVGTSLGEILRAFGTGSRFESIERGVIDFRDLLYYLSITVFFLTLNVLSLDSKRWSRGLQLLNYRQNRIIAVVLIGLNLFAVNMLVYSSSSARLDLTQYQEYSLSPATRDILSNIQEPLLIRGYFSENSHPLLAPLVPRIKDTLREYEIASNGNLKVEFVDPITNPELEQEANQVYGIRPTPLQVNARGGVSLVNVYFDVLIRYGDQNVVLNFGDLIEVNQSSTGADVRLRNIEYDLTSSIQKVVFGFQSLDAVLASLENPAKLTLYVTPDSLPDSIGDAYDVMQKVSNDLTEQYPDKLQFNIVDMSSADAPSQQELFDKYQIQPIATSFFSQDSFYLHMVIEAGDKVQLVYPSGDLSESDIKNAIESALKRASSGFLQVVGIWTPPEPQQQPNAYGQQTPNLQQYTLVQDSLSENYEVKPVTLTDGKAPTDVDVLLIIAPYNMTDLELYAVDQYLMRGGAVLVADGYYHLGVDMNVGALSLVPSESKFEDMLASYGITIGQEAVMDTHNAPFPMQVQRDLGNGMMVNELQAMDYPYFVEVRPDAMNQENSIVSNLPSLTMAWASPITLDEEKLADAKTATLLSSSSEAWTTTDTALDPNMAMYPDTGFPTGSDTQVYALGVTVEGSLDSYFIDKPSPFDTPATDDANAANPATTPNTTSADTADKPDPIGLIESSPDSARLVVFGSAEFVNDNVSKISNSLGNDRFLNSIQVIQNAIDWFTQDKGLASIRSRGSAARILPPISDGQQNQWMLLNYVVGLIGLIAIGVVWQIRKRTEKAMELTPPQKLSTFENTITKGGE